VGIKKVLNKIFYALARRLIGSITHVSTSEPLVALTFDDGPHPEFTPHILDTLEQHKALATFFMLGKNAKHHQDLVKKVGQAGHAIGNHSWDHLSFDLIPRRQRRSQIYACQKAIAPYGEKLFRPPYGNQTIHSSLDVFLLGYKIVTWSAVAQDWLDHDANRLVDYLMPQIKPGSIIVFHDNLNDFLEKRYLDRKETINAVDSILKELHKSFRFVTVPELLSRGRPRRKLWKIEADADFLNQLQS
jgi:peptidoglycan/xylan/chitin deacetylase (PgdA/CDA1 family)